eukprot:GHVU01040961.1.p1 GENE.GHVU01040961.1~~GHVU01040961.1.p1  ORF type:complete len:614 (+),score=115.50 GHVU01040961.1:289-2130(+)
MSSLVMPDNLAAMSTEDLKRELVDCMKATQALNGSARVGLAAGADMLMASSQKWLAPVKVTRNADGVAKWDAWPDKSLKACRDFDANIYAVWKQKIQPKEQPRTYPNRVDTHWILLNREFAFSGDNWQAIEWPANPPLTDDDHKAMRIIIATIRNRWSNARVTKICTHIFSQHVCVWMDGHHVVSEWFKKIVRETEKITDKEDKLDDFLPYLHAAGHAVDTRVAFWAWGKYDTHVPAMVLDDLDLTDAQKLGIAGVPGLAEDARMRMMSMPAGTAKAIDSLVALKAASNNVLGTACMTATDMRPLATACFAVSCDPIKYHYGAKFLLGKRHAEAARVPDYPESRKQASIFVHACMPGSTLAKSAVLFKVEEVNGDPIYTALMAARAAILEAGTAMIESIKQDMKLHTTATMPLNDRIGLKIPEITHYEGGNDPEEAIMKTIINAGHKITDAGVTPATTTVPPHPLNPAPPTPSGTQPGDAHPPSPPPMNPVPLPGAGPNPRRALRGNPLLPSTMPQAGPQNPAAPSGRAVGFSALTREEQQRNTPTGQDTDMPDLATAFGNLSDEERRGLLRSLSLRSGDSGGGRGDGSPAHGRGGSEQSEPQGGDGGDEAQQ